MVTINDEAVIIHLKNETEAEEVAEPAEPEEVAEPVEEVAEEPPTLRRKPGRPVGAKSKEPGKPRAKRVILKEVVEVPMAQEPNNTMRIPTSSHECVYNDTSSRMLQMLADHSQSRKKRKTDLWRSWFN